MKLSGIKEKTGSVKKLSALLSDKEKQVYGVHYTNSFFSQRYLCRSHVLSKDVNIEEDEVKLTITVRLESAGLLEVDNTLDALVQHEAGDVPGYTPESILPTSGSPMVDRPVVPEYVAADKELYSVDFFLILNQPTITYKEFTIAGNKFTLVKIHKDLSESFSQTVTLLFGDVGKLYFLSHFHEKNLSVRDTKMILDLIVDENLTGRAIVGVKMETSSGFISNLTPYNSIIGSYVSPSKEIVFSTDAGYTLIPIQGLGLYKLTCEAVSWSGSYMLQLESNTGTVQIYFE